MESSVPRKQCPEMRKDRAVWDPLIISDSKKENIVAQLSKAKVPQIRMQYIIGVRVGSLVFEGVGRRHLCTVPLIYSRCAASGTFCGSFPGAQRRGDSGGCSPAHSSRASSEFPLDYDSQGPLKGSWCASVAFFIPQHPQRIAIATGCDQTPVVLYAHASFHALGV